MFNGPPRLATNCRNEGTLMVVNGKGEGPMCNGLVRSIGKVVTFLFSSFPTRLFEHPKNMRLGMVGSLWCQCLSNVVACMWYMCRGHTLM